MSTREQRAHFFSGRIDRLSRAPQRPASTSARKSPSVWLNSAGSSMFTVWPLFGNIARPEVAMCLLQPDARLDAGIVLVAADDQRRQRDLLHLRLEVVDRRPPDLIAAQRVGGALRRRGSRTGRRTPCSRAGPSPRTECAPGPCRRSSRPPPSRACRIPSRSPRAPSRNSSMHAALRAGAGAGERERERALRILDADAERRVAAHRQAADMRLVDLEMIEHRDHVVAELLVAVGRRASAARRRAYSRAPNR